jgi:hypothetical protein
MVNDWQPNGRGADGRANNPISFGIGARPFCGRLR